MALVLSRRKDESIVIGDAVVTVVAFKGDSVRLAIQAPRHVPVHRAEVHQRIHQDEAVSIRGIEQRRPVEQSSGYEPVRGDVPADASVKPSQQNLQRSEEE